MGTSKNINFVIDKTTSHSTDETTDRTTSHLTSPAKDAGQVIGYSHPTKQPAEELLAGHPKDGCQVVGYKPASGQVAGYPAQAGIQLNLDRALAVKASKSQGVAGRVLTRHVGLKPDLRSNELFGLKQTAGCRIKSGMTDF